MLILFFERKKKWFIIPAAILLPFFHFALAAIFILGLVITYIQNREKYRLLPLILLALSSLSVVFINSFDRYYGGFWPDLKLLIDFIDPFLHLFPLIIIILLARKSLRNYLPFIIASFLVFVFINRFSFYAIVIFDIFVVLAAVDSFTAEKSFDRFKKGVVVLSLLAFFVQFLFLILPGNPFYRGDVVWDQTLYQRPLDWIKANTDPKSVFAIWPLGQERSNLLFAVRNVYIGAGGGDVGLVPDERVEQVMKIYKNISIPEEVDYVFYGPVEHLNFPDFSPKINAVYDDGIIKIYAAK